MRNIFIAFFCLIVYSAFSVDEYPYEKALTIPSGNYENQIKCFVYDPHFPGGHGAPTTYTISDDEKIYITDDLKNRIAIYDLNGNYAGQVINNSLKLDYPFDIAVGGNGDIIYLSSGDGPLFRIKSNGNLIYKTDYSSLSSKVYQRNGFNPYDDYLFYSGDKDKLKCLDPNGKNLDDDTIRNLLSKINSNLDNSKELKSISSLKAKLDNFTNNNTQVLFNNRLFSNNPDTYKKYWSLLKQNAEIQALTAKITIKMSNEVDLQQYNERIMSILGYDKDSNSYWEGIAGPAGGWVIIVINKYGSVLDVFKIDKKKYFNYRISPNGDIYSWQIAKEGVTFYKITRRW